MDQQRVEEKNEKEEQSEESESVTDRSEEEMSDMTIAFEWEKESAKNDDAKTYDPYFGMTIPRFWDPNRRHAVRMQPKRGRQNLARTLDKNQTKAAP